MRSIGRRAPQTQRVEILARSESIFVVASALCREGLWRRVLPVEVLSAEASNAELGSVVAAALDRQVRAPRAKQEDEGFVALKRAAKVRSWKALVDGARMVNVVRDATGTRIEVWDNLGAREGFVAAVLSRGVGGAVVLDESPVLTPVGDAVLGAAVRECLERARQNP